MWFWLSLIALLCWSGSDLFSKIGCRDARDKYSHLKMVMAVGVVMGLHAAYEVFVGGTVINLDIILTYLPVSILYILSMAMGYVGLRYIELSISSPICNSSGALVAVLAILFDGIAGYSPWPCSPWRWCVWAPWAWVWWRPGRMTNCASSGRRQATTSTPRASWPWPCLRLTACWTLPAPLPTAGCWRSSAAPWRTTRPAPTWPMS